ncbi:hypothetical protein BAUCODRAFT_69080, partial [Baudoinia panamericana UAMH 10762]
MHPATSAGLERRHCINLIRPDCLPIALEIVWQDLRDIYDRILAREERCAMITSILANDLSFNYEQNWPAMFQEHRALIYECNNFLIKEQQYSAAPSQGKLSRKYEIVRRMWDTGVWTLAKVLYKQMPRSQPYLVEVSEYSYQMITFLYRADTAFYEDWCKFLADLAVLRHYIEQDADRSRFWRTRAAEHFSRLLERQPGEGRLYHGLAVL